MDINAVITGDLVKSRRIHEGDIETVINFLKSTFKDINELSVIGFLIAAKLVFRFGDLKKSPEQKKRNISSSALF
jgi:hypothetical protein